MFSYRVLRNAFVIGLLVVLVPVAGLRAEASAEPAGDPLLKMVPAESLFCIRVNNLNYTLSQTDQFLAGVSPIPMGVSMLARMQLANVLGSPDLSGVDMDGDLAIVGAILPGEAMQSDPMTRLFIGALVPITDHRQFISGNANCSEPDEKGVSKITSNGTDIMLVTQAGQYALMGWANSYDKVLAYKKLMGIGTSASAEMAPLAGALDTAEAKLAVTKPIWAYGNVQQANKTFGPMVSAEIEKMRIESFGPDGPAASPRNTQNPMNILAGILETLMKETRCFSITVDPKPNVLIITETISAVPGTDMAEMFVSDASAQQANKLLMYLEDGAMMSFGLKLDTPFWRKLNIMGIDLLETIASESVAAEDAAKMKALASDMIGCLDGPVACSISMDAGAGLPFAIKQIVAVRDQQKFNRLIPEATQMLSTGSFAELDKGMGVETSFSTERGVELYKGVSIDSAKLAVKSADVNSPEALMIQSMYGGGFEYRWAVVDRLFVGAIGGDVSSAIRELIDQVKTPEAKEMAAEIKAALALLPEADKADFVGTYNALRLLKMAAAIAPVPIPQMDIPTRSNIVVAGRVGDGKMVVDIAVPKEHLAEIVTGAMMMQQKMMQSQQEKMQTTPESRSGIDSISEQQKTWVKCNNPDCKAEYQMGLREYFRTIQERIEPMAMSVPALVCEKCGRESTFRAEKCAKCGLIFVRGVVANDFHDRCPECGYSRTEEQRKQRLKARRPE